MRAIGFSTGALAKGDFRTGIALQNANPVLRAIELSALRDHELPALAAAGARLDVAHFTYVSVHAPSKLSMMSEGDVFAHLRQLPANWPIIVHPELVRTPSLWRGLGRRLSLENMDNRKTTGRTVAEMRELFESLPEAEFCLDLGHARQIDSTMATAMRMAQEFGTRLRQLHVSEVGPRGDHLPLSALAIYAFQLVAPLIPRDCSVIIESVVAPDGIERNEPPHVHVDRDDLSAKFWLHPVALARNFGFPAHELRRIRALLEEHQPNLLEAWNGHIGTER